MMENKCKRFLSLLLAFVMVLGMFPAGHAHAEGETVNILSKPVTELQADAEYQLFYNGSRGVHGSVNTRGGFTGLDTGSGLSTSAIANDAKYIWTLKAADGGYRLYNAAAGKYAKLAGSTASMENEENSSVFVFEHDAAAGTFKIKTVDGLYFNNLGGQNIMGGYGSDAVVFTIRKVLRNHTHNAVDIPAVAPTLNSTGLTAGQECVDCGTVISGRETVAVKDYNDGIVPVDKITPTAGTYNTPTHSNDGGPAYALDSNLDTKWHTNYSGDSGYGQNTAENRWIDFAIDGAYDVTALRYKGRAGNGNITKYKILVSYDGTTYSELTSGNWANNADWKEVVFETPLEQVKNVRLLAVESNAGHAVANEMRLVGEVHQFAEHVHTEEILDAVPVTIGADGKTEGKKCSECGEIILAQEVIPALYKSKAVPSGAFTATVGSYETSSATEGNANLALDDNFGTMWHTTWAGTARENLWFDFELTADYEVSGLYYKPRNGAHNGTITKYQVLGSYDGESWFELTSGDWDLNDSWKEATFNTAKVKHVRLMAVESTCDQANKNVASAAEIRLVGVPCDHFHRYTVSVTDPTCTQNGTKTLTCTCGDTKTETIPAAHGTITHVAPKTANCTETGNIEYWYCDICFAAWLDEACTRETTLADVVIPITHNVLHVAPKAATCTEAGNIEYWYCADCGAAWLDAERTQGTNLQAVVLPITHNVKHVEAKAATCTEAGNIEHWYCADCGQCWLDDDCTLNTNENAVVLPALGHTYEREGGDANAVKCGDCGTANPYYQPVEVAPEVNFGGETESEVVPEEVKDEIIEDVLTNEAVNDYKPVEEHKDVEELEITFTSATVKNETPTALVFTVTPKMNGQKVSNPSEPITFRLPVPNSVAQAFAKVFHDGVEMDGLFEVKVENGDKYVEITSDSFSEYKVEFTAERSPIKVSNKAELNAALAAAQEGDTIVLTADIDYGTDHLKIDKAITLDLGGKTLTTRARNYGLALYNGCTVTNGKLNHAGTVAAIKVWDAKMISNLEIDVTGTSSSGNTIDGIVIQENATGVDTIKNVTIHSTAGQGVDTGIKTYNCGNATEPVIGSMDYVTVDAKTTGLNISALCGTATNCSISGGVNGIELWIKGTYSASLTLVDSKVEGGVYAHDEFSSNPGVTNNGTLTLTVDENTTGASAEDVTLTLNRIEEEQVKGEVLENIIETAQAKVNGTYYATVAEAIKAAKAGDTVYVLEGTYNMPSMKAGITIEGVGNVLFNGTLTGTLENLTLKNIHIKGANAQRWAYAKGNLVFENVTFEATSIYALHFDGIAAGTNLTYKNCTIIGWAAMGGSPASCVFDGCTIKGNGTYGVIRTYFPATIENCTFDVSAVNPNDAYQDGIHAVDATVTVNDCKNVNGDMKDIVYTTTDKKAAYVVLDGVEIHTHKWLEVESVEPDFGVEGYKLFKCLCGAEEKRDVVAAKVAVAVIGEQKFETLAAAIAAANAGDTITFVADITENVTISKSVTIDGAGKTYTGTMTGNKGLTITIENVNFVNGGFSKSTKSNNGTYTIKNCTFDGQGTYAYPVCIKGASKLVVEDCVVSNYLYSFLYVTSGTNTVSVKNVTVENCPNYAVYFASGVNNATFENLTVKNSDNGFVINNSTNRSFTIKDCKMENVVTAIDHTGGTKAITCTAQGNNDFGTAVLSEYAKVVLTENATLTAPAGLNVTTNAGDGYKVIYEEGVYKVVHAPAAMIGTKGYATLGEAFAAAQNGETIVVMKDIDLAKETPVLLDGSYNTYFKVEGKNVTVNMNGMTISGAYTDSGKMLVGVFSTDNGGHLTVTGNGTVNLTATAKVYSLFANYEPGCSITIEDGAYTLDKAHDSLLYSGCNTAENEGITVNGGTFTLGNVGTGTNGKPWIINCLGGNDNATVVNGGTFNSDISHQFWANEVSIPADLALKNNGDGTWTIGEAVACAEEKATSTGAAVRKVGYATLQEAIDAAANGKTVTLLKDIELAKETTVLLDGSYNTYFKVEGKSVIIDLNGKTISGEYADTSKMLVGVFSTENGGHLTLTGNGTVNLTEGEGATVYSLMSNYDDDCTITIENGTYTLNSAWDCLLHSSCDKGLIIKGGNFKLDNVAEGHWTGNRGNGSPWIINVNGKNEGAAVVSGGTYNYDISNQHWIFEVDIQDGKGNLGVIVNNGNGTWTVTGETAEAGTVNYSNGYERLTGYATLADALAAAKPGQTVRLLKNIAVEKSVAITGNRNVVIDLNGYTLSSAKAHIVTSYYSNTTITIIDSVGGGKVLTTGGGKHGFVNQSNLVIDGAEIASNKGGNAIVSQTEKANITIQNDAVINGKIVIKAGSMTITGGTFNDKLEVTAVAKVEISAGYFKYPVQAEWCAEGYIPTGLLENGYYSVMEDPANGMAAVINGTYYATLQEAIAAAATGDTITVLADIAVDTSAVVANSSGYAAIYNIAEKDIIIDLNGKKIEATVNAADLESYKDGILLGVFCVDINGKLTLTGEGTVTANLVDGPEDPTASKLNSLLVAYGTGSELVVENGTFHANSVSSALVYSQYDEIITINGGTYTLGNLGKGRNGSPWLFNAKGQNERNILVNGGTFSADIQHQYYPFEVQMPKELALSKGEDSMYTVVPAVAYVNEQEWSSAWYTNYVGYATVEEAKAAVEPIKTKVIGKNTYYSDREVVTLLVKEEVNLEDVLGGEIANVDLPAGDFTLPTTSGDVSITGTKDTVITVNDVTAKQISMSGVTVKSSGVAYTGIKHSEEVVFNDCTIVGNMYLYAENVVFTNCTFDLSETNDYIWVYGAKNVTFKDCTFNTMGKAILVFQDGSSVDQTVTVEGCTFNATQPGYNWNHTLHIAAVSMDGSQGGTYNVILNNNTVDNNFNGLWQDKTSAGNITVTVDGTTVLTKN